MAVVETEPLINAGDLGLDGALVGEEQPGRAALDDGGRDGARFDVGEGLGGEHNACVLLAQRLEPLAQLRPEGRIVKGEPALIDDQQRGAAVEPVLNAVEQVGEYGGSGVGTDQAFCLERLDAGLAEMLGLGIKEPPPRTADAIGPQRLLKLAGLKEDRKAGQGALRQWSSGKRVKRRPQELLGLGR